jgi:hypothetical protein
MSLESEIERLAGIKIGTPLNAAETALYEQLRNKRVTIALEIIPLALRDDFTSVVYPDRNLRWYAQALNRNRELHSKAVSDFLTAHMRASLIAGGLGQKLELRGVRPEDVLMKMVEGM